MLGDDSHGFRLKKLDWRLWLFYALSVWVQSLACRGALRPRREQSSVPDTPPPPGWTGFPHNRSPPPHAPARPRQRPPVFP